MVLSIVLNLLAVFILLLGVGAVTSAGFLYGAPFLLLGALTFPKVKAAVMQKSGHAHAKRNYSLSLAGLTVISLMAAAMAPDIDTEPRANPENKSQVVQAEDAESQQERKLVASLISEAEKLESNGEYLRAAEYREKVDSINGNSAQAPRIHDLRDIHNLSAKATKAVDPSKEFEEPFLEELGELLSKWDSVEIAEASGRKYTFTLHYRESAVITSLREVEDDTKSIARAALRVLMSQGRKPKDEWMSVYVSAFQPAGTGETGSPLTRMWGSSHYDFNADQLVFKKWNEW